MDKDLLEIMLIGIFIISTDIGVNTNNPLLVIISIVGAFFVLCIQAKDKNVRRIKRR